MKISVIHFFVANVLRIKARYLMLLYSLEHTVPISLACKKAKRRETKRKKTEITYPDLECNQFDYHLHRKQGSENVVHVI